VSREAWGDPPDPEPQRCPVCDGEWHAEGCELGEEVSRRLKAETEARTLRCRYAVVSGWIVEALKVLDTLDPEHTTEADELHKLIKAGEVLALTALAQSKTPNVGGEPETTASTNL
jgi:hypothetical protein